jgi:hypothetical protein
MEQNRKILTFKLPVIAPGESEARALDLVLSHYRSNGALAVLLEDAEDGSHHAALSVNIEGKSEHLLQGEFYLKHWDEGAAISRRLLELKAIELVESYPPVRSGFIENIQVYRLTAEKLEAALNPEAPSCPDRVEAAGIANFMYTHSVRRWDEACSYWYIEGYAREVIPATGIPEAEKYVWCYVRLLGLPYAGEYGHLPQNALLRLAHPISEEVVRKIETFADAQPYNGVRLGMAVLSES